MHINRIRISCAIVIVFASSVHMVDRVFESRSSEPKTIYNWYSLLVRFKHTALRRKSTDRLARNQDSVSEWGRYVYSRTVASVS